MCELVVWRRTHTRASVVQHGVWEPRETHHCLAKQLRGSGDECDDDDGRAMQSDEPDGEADDDGDATAAILETRTTMMPMQRRRSP